MGGVYEPLSDIRFMAVCQRCVWRYNGLSNSSRHPHSTIQCCPFVIPHLLEGRGGGQGCIGRGGGYPPPLPGRPAYIQPLSPWQQVPGSMAFVTDSNRPELLWQPPPTAWLTAAGNASEVPCLLMHPWGGLIDLDDNPCVLLCSAVLRALPVLQAPRAAPRPARGRRPTPAPTPSRTRGRPPKRGRVLGRRRPLAPRPRLGHRY